MGRDRADGVIGRELGDELGVSAQKISYHIGKLEEKGLVETHPDGRQKKIELSDVGRLYLRWTGGECSMTRAVKNCRAAY
jgi:DNA-binding MarR family transcriptional regulator